jgi:hypothetical protein
MAYRQQDLQTVPATPSAGKGIDWFDSTLELRFFKDDSGRSWGQSHRAAVASQGAGFATDTYVTDSGLLVPSFGVQAQTMIEWILSVSKTAAGTATPIYQIRIGANQTTADTSRLTLTGPAQTAAVDIGYLTILVVVRTVGAGGVIQGSVNWSHNGAAAGFANNDAGAVEGTSAGFDNSALQGSFIGLSINGGASAAWTVTQCRGQVIW